MEPWIDISCSNCHRTTRVKRETVLSHPGKSFRCKDCGQSVQLPELAAEPEPSPNIEPVIAEAAVVPAVQAVAPQVQVEDAPAPGSLAAFHRQREEDRRRRRKTLLWICIPAGVLALFVLVGGTFAWIVYAVMFSGTSTTAQADGSSNGPTSQRSSSFSSNTSAPSTGDGGVLVLDWPPSARHEAKVYIDKEEVALRTFGDNRFNLPAGSHEVIVKKYGETVDSHSFGLVAGAQYVYELPKSAVLRLQELDLMSEQPAIVGNAGVDTAQVFESWKQSIDAAKAQAASQGKSLLIYFDGSDWCPYCRQLTAEVLVKPEFRSFVDNQFVLVHIDFPRYGPARGKVEDAQRNADVAQYYGVSAYPTMLLADEQGQPIVKLGYDQQGVRSFLLLMQKAVELRGQRRARIAAVEAALQRGESPSAEDIEGAVPEYFRSHYSATASRWYELASTSDPENKRGLREEMFWFWWEATMRRRDLDAPEKLKEMQSGLTRFTDECEFDDPSKAANLYLMMAVLTRRVDIAQSQEIARQGIEFAPKDEGLKQALTQLAQGLLSGGSGVLISNDGYMITNQHVVGFANEVTVTLGDKADQELIARVIATDVPNDLALIKLNNPQDAELNPLTLMSTPVEKGEEIFVCGFPGFEKYMVITDGIVSLPARQQPKNMILLDSTVNPGNSGGPLIGASGQVAGLLVQKTLTSEDTDSMGLAIPVDRILSFLAQHLSEGELAKVAVEAARDSIPSSLNQVVEPGTVRILVKQVPISREVAESMNDDAWAIVRDPGRESQEYARALDSAQTYCRAFPVGFYMNTLGVAYYRNGQYHEAAAALVESATLNEEELGYPHPIDLATLAMAQFQLGETGTARSIYRQLENLMAQEVFAENEECVQFFDELKQLLER